MVRRYPKMYVCIFLVFAFIAFATSTQSDKRVPDISGNWNSSSGDVYRITQKGIDFTWLNTRTNQKMSGKIEGDKLIVTWTDRTGKHAITGVINEFDSSGVPKKITWSNRMIFYRQTQPLKVSPIKGLVLP
jgi:hypothetical protein